MGRLLGPTLGGVIFLVALGFSSGITEVVPSSIKHVSVLFRHGDRTPYIIFPNDINQESAWPDGLGWLTNEGIKQQYELGQLLRQRYRNLMDFTHYNHQLISVQASARDRCIMSALANLAGMFQPEGDQVWDNTDLGRLWRPVPLHSIPSDQDNRIALGINCPRYNELYEEVFSSKQVRDYEKANQTFFDLLSNNSGWNEASTLKTTWKIIDPVVCERAHGMNLSEFLYQDGVLERLEEIQHLSWDMQYSRPEMAKLMGGPLLKEIVDNMKKVMNGSSDVRMHMYSGHDSTVSALLNALRVSDGKQPAYAATLIVELHHTKDVGYFVSVHYRGDRHSPIKQRPQPGCDQPCGFSKFEKAVEDMIPHDWAKECHIPTPHKTPDDSQKEKCSVVDDDHNAAPPPHFLLPGFPLAVMVIMSTVLKATRLI